MESRKRLQETDGNAENLPSTSDQPRHPTPVIKKVKTEPEDKTNDEVAQLSARVAELEEETAILREQNTDLLREREEHDHYMTIITREHNEIRKLISRDSISEALLYPLQTLQADLVTAISNHIFSLLAAIEEQADKESNKLRAQAGKRPEGTTIEDWALLKADLLPHIAQLSKLPGGEWNAYFVLLEIALSFRINSDMPIQKFSPRGYHALEKLDRTFLEYSTVQFQEYWAVYSCFPSDVKNLRVQAELLRNLVDRSVLFPFSLDFLEQVVADLENRETRSDTDECEEDENSQQSLESSEDLSVLE